MPETRYFKVIQTREVKVISEDAEGAVRLAEAAFTHGQNKSEATILAGHGPEGVWGNTRTRIREVKLECVEG